MKKYTRFNGKQLSDEEKKRFDDIEKKVKTYLNMDMGKQPTNVLAYNIAAILIR